MTQTTDTSTLQNLLTRVEAATGPDARLNAALTCAFILPGLRPAEPTDFDGKFGYSPGDIKVEHGFLQAHDLTGSVDEALALVERVLGKHWLYEIKSGIEKHCILWMLETDYDDDGPPTGWHANSVPLAILAALLKALIAKEAHAPR